MAIRVVFRVHRLPWLIPTALVVLCASFVTTQWPTAWPTTSPGAATALTASAPAFSSRQVETAHASEVALFGNAEVQDAVPVIAEKPVSDTVLPLQLVGILRTNHSRHDTNKSDVSATALIAEERGQPSTYHINDKLPGDATLVAIYPLYVVLKRQGNLEALRFVALPDKTTSQSASQKTYATSSVPSVNTAPSAHEVPALVMNNEQIRNELQQRALALQSPSASE